MTATVQFANLGVWIDRAYAQSSPYQWAREAYQNSVEAGATRVLFDVVVNPQDPSQLRWAVIDDGTGMTGQELERYFGLIGQSSKNNRGMHANFGLGIKAGLMGWNPAGIGVMSWTEGSAPSLVVLERHGDELRLAKYDGQTVHTPLDGYRGVRWSSLRHKWNYDHGTAIVLLGHHDQPSTWGTDEGADPRYTQTPKAVASFMQQRLVDTHQVKLQITANPTVSGCSRYISITGVRPALLASTTNGTVELPGGVQVEWFLLPERARASKLPPNQISPIYQNELYGADDSASQQRANLFRLFGIPAGEARQRIWLLVRPPEYDEHTNHGVYCDDRRHRLLYASPQRSESDLGLPWAEWGELFIDHTPGPIREAIRLSLTNIAVGDRQQPWRRKLEQMLRHLAVPGTPASRQTPKKPTIPPPTREISVEQTQVVQRQRNHVVPVRPGQELYQSTRPKGQYVRLTIPDGRYSDNEADFEAPWVAATYNHATRTVLVNANHPHFQDVINHHVETYLHSDRPEIYAAVREVVLDHFVGRAVAIVGNWRLLSYNDDQKGSISPYTDVRNLADPSGALSDVALTTAMLGWLTDQHIIASRLGGMKLGKKKGQS